ncbi:MAG: hypothetical protein HY275_08850 [Gemmatimonadetes bacterium]|nr:hypothetical protein [Gemmatimonadota bacterium]
MRTVAEPSGLVWICLELPERPGAPAQAKVEVECNSGAERVTIAVERGWDSAMADGALLGAIHAQIGR